jgi:tetratricopeptide (TPR) repeat protein
MTTRDEPSGLELALRELTPSARALSEWLAGHDWDFEAAARARGTDPRSLYRDWLESLDWNRALAARLYRRRETGRPVSRQAIEAQMKKYRVTRPPDFRKSFEQADLDGVLSVLADARAAVREKSTEDRLCCELLLSLSASYSRLGDHQKARGALIEVVAIARRAGAPELAARAVVALSQLTFQISPYGRYDRDTALLMEEWLPMLREAGNPEALAICLARLGYEVHQSGEAEARKRSDELTGEAFAVSRGAASPYAVCSAVGYRCAALDAPEQLADRLELLEEVLEDGRLYEDDFRYFLIHLHASDVFEAGRVEEAALLFDQLHELEPLVSAPWPQRYRATLAVLQGDWDEAHRLSTQTVDAPMDSAAQVRALQQFEAMKQLGEWETLANLVRWNLNQEPSAPIGWRIAFGLVGSLLGNLDEVRPDFETWRDDAFECVPPDLAAMSSYCSLAEIAHALEDERGAEILYEILEPFREQLCAIRVMACVRAPVARYLGLLAATLGDVERASADFQHAIDLCERAQARPYLAWTRYDYARLLAGRIGRAEEARVLAREAADGATQLRMDWLATRARELAI